MIKSLVVILVASFSTIAVCETLDPASIPTLEHLSAGTPNTYSCTGFLALGILGTGHSVGGSPVKFEVNANSQPPKIDKFEAVGDSSGLYGAGTLERNPAEKMAKFLVQGANQGGKNFSIQSDSVTFGAPEEEKVSTYIVIQGQMKQKDGQLPVLIMVQCIDKK